MNTIKTCPSCRKPLTADAPDGLCPVCLAKAALPLGMDPGPESQAESGRIRFQAPSVDEIARLFPNLEILDFIGQGGMGAVYRVRQKELDRMVALKILPPDLGADPAFADRFAREARALAKLNHPGIVAIYEFGRTDGLFFFLMELVDGVNLRQLLSMGRISPREALAIVPPMCDALQYAHDQGIVHRDIKPENILLDRRGQVKVADFGLAKLVGGGDPAVTGTEVEFTDASLLTEAGKVMGTPQYMTPEQLDHFREVDHRADIYSLGVVFYQMLTGELPGKSLVPPSRKVRVDVRLDEVVLRALENEPERRYQQARQVKTDMEAISSTEASAPAPVNQPAPTAHQAKSQPGRPRKQGLAALALALGLAGPTVAFPLSFWQGPNGELARWVLWALLYAFEIPALVGGWLTRQTRLGKAAILFGGMSLLMPFFYVGWDFIESSRRAKMLVRRNQGLQQIVDIAKMPGGPWIGTYPGGGEVELLGLAPHPSTNQSWWRPDGSPLNRGDSLAHPWRHFALRSGPHFLVRELVFRFGHLPVDASSPEYHFEPNGIYLFGQAGDALGQEAPYLERLAVSLPKSFLPSSSMLRFRVGVALGAWSTVATSFRQGGVASIIQDDYSWTIQFAKATELNGQTAVTVTHTVTNREARVVAFDADGTEHKSNVGGHRRTGPSYTGPIRTGPFTQLTTTFPDLPLEQVKVFHFQVRPYEWIEFRNVALHPRE